VAEYHRTSVPGLTHDRIRNGVFKSVAQLVDAIRLYVDHHDAHPTSFVWTKKAQDILETNRPSEKGPR